MIVVYVELFDTHPHTRTHEHTQTDISTHTSTRQVYSRTSCANYKYFSFHAIVFFRSLTSIKTYFRDARQLNRSIVPQCEHVEYI